MNLTYDLKHIKKHYGEEMMHLCRELFPNILEDEGALSKILDNTFAYSKNLGEDILSSGKKYELKSYIYNQYDNRFEEKTETDKSPEELMKEAGYTLYPECETEEELQSFKKYWASGEELCSFKKGNLRLNFCRVWFAIKDNIEEIRREDFTKPMREDEYGTSAISIQFSKADSSLSIKNRYNHTVKNPDNTFFNNLDNIICGLSDAFEKKYNLKDKFVNSTQLELENYCSFQGKLYHYNYEINNVYYCDNNIILDRNNGKLIVLNEHQILAGYHIFDKKEKSVYTYKSLGSEEDKAENFEGENAEQDNRAQDKIVVVKMKDGEEIIIKLSDKDVFAESFGEIENIEQYGRAGQDKKIVVKVKDGEDIIVKLSDSDDIVGLINNNVKSVGDYFLFHNEKLEELSMDNLEECGSCFLRGNYKLKELNLPNLRSCEGAFLDCNSALEKLCLPSLEYCGSNFLPHNKELRELKLENLEQCGMNFLCWNTDIEKVELPSLAYCSHDFLYENNSLLELSLPSLEACGDGFLNDNKILKKLYAPNLKLCGDRFLQRNTAMEEISLPNLQRCGELFLYNAPQITSVRLPALERCGDCFMYYNVDLKKIILPQLISCGKCFLWWNEKIEVAVLPNLEKCKEDFLLCNRKILDISLPNLKKCGNRFLSNNKILEEVDMPSLEECGDEFMARNAELIYLYLPELVSCGDSFLRENEKFFMVELPKLDSHGKGFLISSPQMADLVEKTIEERKGEQILENE